MIVKKNFDMKIEIDSDIVSSYFKECLEKPEELSTVADKIDPKILSYLSAFYLGKLHHENPDEYNKFMKFMPKGKGTEKMEETEKSNTPVPIEEGDIVFMKLGTFRSLFDTNWERYTVLKVTGEFVYLDSYGIVCKTPLKSLMDSVIEGKDVFICKNRTK